MRWGLPGDCVHRAYSTGTVSGMWVTLGTLGVRHKMQCLEKRLTLQSVNVCPNVYGLGGGHHGDCGHVTAGAGYWKWGHSWDC